MSEKELEEMKIVKCSDCGEVAESLTIDEYEASGGDKTKWICRKCALKRLITMVKPGHEKALKRLLKEKVKVTLEEDEEGKLGIKWKLD